jgi:hypothetical protein
MSASLSDANGHSHVGSNGRSKAPVATLRPRNRLLPLGFLRHSGATGRKAQQPPLKRIQGRPLPTTRCGCVQRTESFWVTALEWRLPLVVCTLSV